jgi:type IV secretory pathway TrbD component
MSTRRWRASPRLSALFGLVAWPLQFPLLGWQARCEPSLNFIHVHNLNSEKEDWPLRLAVSTCVSDPAGA